MGDSGVKKIKEALEKYGLKLGERRRISLLYSIKGSQIYLSKLKDGQRDQK